LRRIIIIRIAIVLVGLALIGVGVAVGSTSSSSQAVTPEQAVTVPQQLCEQAVQDMRATHPDAHVSGCNSGVGTISTP